MNTKNEMNIFYTKEGDGNDVLFLHGWGCNSSTFCGISSRLMGYRVTSVDLWGFGNTPLPTEAVDGWNTTDYADNVAKFIILQNFRNLTVVGHSFGGRIAVVLASKYPNLVNKLVLVDSAGFKKFSIKKWLEIKRYKRLKKRAQKSQKAEEKLKNMGSSDFKACNDVLKRTFIKVVNQSLDEYASEIKCHTLLIWGQKDADTPLWMARRYNKLIKKSGLVVFKNCGHFCFLEKSNLFLAVLKSFLASEV